MLAETSERLKFLVAFRPGLVSPTLAAQMAATFQWHSGGRLLLNVVTGGDADEQRAFGDFLEKEERYRRTGEFLEIVRRLWDGETVDFAGEHLRVEGATIHRLPDPRPEIYFGGSSPAGIEVAAAHVDVYLTWGEPPAAVAEKVERVRAAAAERGREVRFGIRLHTISRDDSAAAWAAGRAPARLGPGRDDRPGPGEARAAPSRRASGGCSSCTAARATRSRSIPTSGPGSASAAAAPAPRWSARTPRSPS